MTCREGLLEFVFQFLALISQSAQLAGHLLVAAGCSVEPPANCIRIATACDCVRANHSVKHSFSVIAPYFLCRIIKSGSTEQCNDTVSQVFEGPDWIVSGLRWRFVQH